MKYRTLLFFSALAVTSISHLQLEASNTQRVIPITESEKIKLIQNSLCEGNITAYEDLMLYVPYYDYFVYSIFMANEYNYAPAYYKAYRIYMSWYNLYEIDFNSEITQNSKFWLQWGMDAGCKSCAALVNAATYSTANFEVLDSVNNFKFVLPIDTYSDSTYIALDKEDTSRIISGNTLDTHKKKRISEMDSASVAMLEVYSHRNGQVYSVNENFLFRVSNHMNFKEKGNSYITMGVLWELFNTYTLCEPFSFDKVFNSKLGIYVLHVGIRANDKAAVIPLAKLYAQGIVLPKNTEYALEILMSIMSEQNARRMIHEWLNGPILYQK